MMISFRKQVNSTLKMCAAVRQCAEPAQLVAECHSISRQIVWKWCRRDSFYHFSHNALRLLITPTLAQKAVVVSLRRVLMLPLHDLLSVAREFLISNVSRSGLGRCVRAYCVGTLSELQPKVPRYAQKPFNAFEAGYVDVDLKHLSQLADDQRRLYQFIAIGRTTQWAFVRICPAETAANRLMLSA